MKLFGWVLKTERQHAADLRTVEDRALSRLVELLSKKDNIYLETVTLEGDGQNIENNVFLGPCSGSPGLVINTQPKQA